MWGVDALISSAGLANQVHEVGNTFGASLYGVQVLA